MIVFRIRFVKVFLVYLLVITKCIFCARKGARKFPAKYQELAHYEESSCPSPQNVAKELQQSVSSMREMISSELDKRIEELSDVMMKALQDQLKCFKESEKKLRESAECHKTDNKHKELTDEHETPICQNDNCKDLSSKMLDLIDHSADPCEDFYQYACGGVEKDIHLFPDDPLKDADRRLSEKLETLDSKNPIMGSAKIFYDACRKWQRTPTSDETIQFAANKIRNIGLFLPVKQPSSIPLEFQLLPTNLTYMLAKFMNSDFAPFFDVTLEPNPSNDEFILVISLLSNKPKLSREIDELTCINDFKDKVKKHRQHGRNVLDLNEEYERYTICKKTTGIDKKLARMVEVVTTLGLLDHVSDVDERKDLLQDMKLNTEILLSVIETKLGSTASLKAAVHRKEYQVNYLKDLKQLLGDHINWEEFFYILTGKWLPQNQKILIYHQKELSEILTIIGQEWKSNLNAVHNSLLMLWSNDVYSKFVAPIEPPEDYCLQATKLLLPDISSSLYLHSFPDVQLTRLQRYLKTHIAAIKNKLSSMLHEIGGNGTDIQKKIESVTVNIGAFVDASSRNNSLMDGIRGMVLNSSHAYNIDFLLQRNRRLMYGLLDEQNESPRAMWINGIVPFEKKGFYVYETNRIFLPVGSFIPPYLYFRKSIPDYIMFGGLGHLAAVQFMRLIDGTGLKFNVDSKSSLDLPQMLVKSSECLSEQLQSEFRLTDDGVTAVYKTMPRDFKLDDLLANSGATRLSWLAYLTSLQDSSAPLKSLTDSPEEQLIWMGKTSLPPIKAYFLRVAQTQCRSSGSFELLDVAESNQLHPRHKVNLVLKNEPLFSEAFQCPSSSSMNQVLKCHFI